MKCPFDKVIVSSDENPKFIRFWPIISKAWKKFFPDVILDLCYITNQKDDDLYIQYLREHGNVYLYPNITHIPQGNQGKICRLYHASQQKDLVCSIHDIDSMPLQRSYLYDLLKLRNKDSLALIGGEYYSGVDMGKAPMVPTTSEGYNFNELFKVGNKNWYDFLEMNKGIKVFDNKEDIMGSSDPIRNPDNYFSDESLLRVYLRDYKKPIQWIRRDAIRKLDPFVDWIDRSYRNFTFDKDKLYSGFYTVCNMIRPFDENKMKEIINYIKS